MWKPDVLKSRTLARRHVLILGVLFFLIQIHSYLGTSTMI